jgi:hypothetical protein
MTLTSNGPRSMARSGDLLPFSLLAFLPTSVQTMGSSTRLLPSAQPYQPPSVIHTHLLSPMSAFWHSRC